MLETYRYAVGKFAVKFSVFQLTGSDVGFFLQNQSTFNFQELKENEFHLMSFLDTQGRIEFYCWTLKKKSEVLLLTPVLLKDQALIRLNKFLISEDVEIKEHGFQEWTFTLGPKSLCFANQEDFKGFMFEEDAILGRDHNHEVPLLTSSEIETWRELNGWPDFSGKDFASEIINNLRLFDLSVTQNKGCYPGQETVSKIATRRGAAYSPVLLQTTSQQTPGPVYLFDKKIGDVKSCYEWLGSFYSPATLLRDFRVAGMKINFSKDGMEVESTVKYYPLLPGNSSEKAQETYYAALDAFKADDYINAEKYLKIAIDLNPQFADAYESLGVILGRLNRFPEAIDLMDQLTKIDASSVMAHTNKSLFLMKMGKIVEAEVEKSLATVKSFQKFGNEAKMKELLEKEKQVQESEWAKREQMFKQVLEIDDEDTLANYGLGSIAVERNDWTAAINYLEKVIQADSNYSVAYLSLGRAYKGAGFSAKARHIWQAGIGIAAKKGDLMPANQMQFELQQL